MPEQEKRAKVIKGLECCSKGDCADCDNCTYHGVQTDVPCESTLMRDALALLKAQEAKPPVIKENSYGWKFYYCPSCGKEFYQNNKFSFCEKCGQAVKWE